jgi:ABC-type glutathione transport system ATPase component
VKLEVRDLSVAFGEQTVVRIEALDLSDGEVLGLAGESGSGKSTLALAILGLTGQMGATVAGSIQLDGRELVGMPEQELRIIRGRRIAMVFQSPVSAFNPVIRIGDLFLRALRHHGVERADARERANQALREVFLPPEMLARYPHQLSGGQAQRAAIALAIALRSELLIADEPTSALDVTVQAEVIEVIRRLQVQERLGVLFISHDLAVLGELSDTLVVLRAGEQVESGPAAQVLEAPQHAYTRELVASMPKLGGALS